VRKLGDFESRAAEMERHAETAAIAAVRSGADPYALANQLGIDPQALISATGWQPPQAGQAGQPGESPSDHPLAQPANDLRPVDFARLFHNTFAATRGMDHAQSWTKPYFTAMDQAVALRESADAAIAEAYSSEDPGTRATKERFAAAQRAQAREVEISAMHDLETRRAGMHMRAYRHLDARLAQFEQAEAARAQQSQQTAAQTQAWVTLGSELRASRFDDDGASEYGSGPGGMGLFEIDAAGNCLPKATPHGEEVFRRAAAIMDDFGWQPTRKNFDAALDLLAMRLHSEGDETVPAGGAAGGGDVTLPATSLAPGAGAVRPSPQAAGVDPAGARMY
jgi:hypothetical protein